MILVVKMYVDKLPLVKMSVDEMTYSQNDSNCSECTKDVSRKMSVDKMTYSQNVNSWNDCRQAVICKNVSRQNDV